MRYFKLPRSFPIGLAMFAMFFGAGNVVFPLFLGKYTGENIYIALLGLFVTAILVPFLGLMTMLLYHGNYKEFFEKLGKKPGRFLIFLIMLLIGPLAGMPRCITLSFSTFSNTFPGTELWIFSLASCIVIFLLAYKKQSITSVLAYFLTPFLLVCLLTIIIVGCFNGPDGLDFSSFYNVSRIDSFLIGLKEGYNTMDLLAALFFSTIVLGSLAEISRDKSTGHVNKKLLLKNAFQSSLIAMSLLTLIYCGFGVLAAKNASLLATVENDALISVLARHTLGEFTSLFSNGAVSLACLTTALTLAVIFASFLKKEFFKNISYEFSLLITLTVTYLITFLRFSGIVQVIFPIIAVCYPVLIVTSIIGFSHKMFGTKFYKWPVILSFIISGFTYLLI
jgi:LIVCS family branched-chain amino acid:cation transporter